MVFKMCHWQIGLYCAVAIRRTIDAIGQWSSFYPLNRIAWSASSAYWRFWTVQYSVSWTIFILFTFLSFDRHVNPILIQMFICFFFSLNAVLSHFVGASWLMCSYAWRVSLHWLCSTKSQQWIEATISKIHASLTIFLAEISTWNRKVTLFWRQ